MRSAILASVILLGCGGDDGGSGDPVPPDQLAEELGPVTCAKMFECCTAEEVMEQLLGAETVEECEEFYLAFIGSLFEPVLEDSIAAGRIVYHADVIGGCIDAYASLACEDVAAALNGSGPLQGCGDPFDPQVELGGECANDFDCIDSFCPEASVDFETGEITYGTCVAIPGIGDPCVDDECDDSEAYCDSSQETPTCEALLSEGSGCTFDSDCATGFCSDANLCAVDMSCDGV